MLIKFDEMFRVSCLSGHLYASRSIMESMIITFRFIFILVHGFSYVRQEAPKGELGLYIVTDNRNKIYRMKIRSPD